MEIGDVRTDRERASVGSDRLGQVTGGGEGDGQAVVVVGLLRLEGRGGGQMRDRVVHAAACRQQRAEATVRFEVAWVERDRGAESAMASSTRPALDSTRA